MYGAVAQVLNRKAAIVEGKVAQKAEVAQGTEHEKGGLLEDVQSKFQLGEDFSYEHKQSNAKQAKSLHM